MAAGAIKARVDDVFLLQGLLAAACILAVWGASTFADASLIELAAASPAAGALLVTLSLLFLVAAAASLGSVFRTMESRWLLVPAATCTGVLFYGALYVLMHVVLDTYGESAKLVEHGVQVVLPAMLMLHASACFGAVLLQRRSDATAR